MDLAPFDSSGWTLGAAGSRPYYVVASSGDGFRLAILLLSLAAPSYQLPRLGEPQSWWGCLLYDPQVGWVNLTILPNVGQPHLQHRGPWDKESNNGRPVSGPCTAENLPYSFLLCFLPLQLGLVLQAARSNSSLQPCLRIASLRIKSSGYR